MEVFDYVAISISGALMLGYHVYYVYNLMNRPQRVVAGWTTMVRKQWVLEILKKKGGDILAVQTLRNWILSATFLATVSMFISFGLLQFLAQSARVVNPTSNTLIIQVLTDEMIGTKTVVILVFNFISFFCFSQSIRYFNHVGFTINIPMEGTEGSEDEQIDCYETADHVAHLLNVGAKFFTVGMRGLYFSIPATFWYFGSVSLLISTTIVLFVVFMADLSDANLSQALRFKKKSKKDQTIVQVQ
jgi:uncharacterized membrane protein